MNNPFDKNKEFRLHFNTNDKFRDHLTSYLIKRYSIDILNFDDWLHQEHGYTVEEYGSMEDFIKVKFGQEAVDFIFSLL